MQQVIIWAAVMGIVIFGLGLLSAIGSRKHRKQNPPTYFTTAVSGEITPMKRTGDRTAGEMSMTASGTGNVAASEGDFATKYGGALAGAGQGREH